MSSRVTRIIACEVMKEELLKVAPQHPVDFYFVSTGLHRWPQKLHEELSRVLRQTSGVERIVLAFGLCGGAVADLRAPEVPVFIPLAHDCIPILLGSRYTHECLLAAEPGTFFLSAGWLEGERTVLSEWNRVREKYGEQKAYRVMATMFDAYRRLVFIRTGHPREAVHLTAAKELARLLGLEFRQMDGRQAWLRRIVNGPWDGDAFLAVPSGQAVLERDFGIS